MRQIPISFKSGGLSLEGVVTQPDTEGDWVGIVLCSPEPQLGGTMESPVIGALVRGLSERGFATLRFNYRGIGSSEGESGLGRGELDDARAAMKMLQSWPGVDKSKIVTVGYSFGAGINARLALREKKSIRITVCVSPPLTLPPLGLQALHDLNSLNYPLLVLIGEKDGLTSPDDLREWVQGLDNSLVQMETVPDADRSWQGKRDELANRIAKFVTRSLALGDHGEMD